MIELTDCHEQTRTWKVPLSETRCRSEKVSDEELDDDYQPDQPDHFIVHEAGERERGFVHRYYRDIEKRMNRRYAAMKPMKYIQDRNLIAMKVSSSRRICDWNSRSIVATIKLTRPSIEYLRWEASLKATGMSITCMWSSSLGMRRDWSMFERQPKKTSSLFYSSSLVSTTNNGQSECFIPDLRLLMGFMSSPSTAVPQQILSIE